MSIFYPLRKKNGWFTGCFFGCLVAIGLSVRGQSLPADFVSAKVQDSYTLPVGMVFGPDNRQLFVWDKAGHIWVSNWNGAQYVRQTMPVLDISEEVGNWGDAGMLSLCLDPNFAQNKRIYLFYIVDRHHLLYAGTPQYSATKNEIGASIGRLTRYQIMTHGSELMADPGSRRILIGESKSTGVPLTHDSHSGATVLFGRDGTLLLTTGDNASYVGMDAGSPSSGNWQQALNDGILRPSENVGSFRSQMLTSLCGKVLRLDPETGDGIASNPFYDAGNARSARSRVWALGFRNPFRAMIQPGTGSANPADANPGTLIINEVGWDQWEELDVVRYGGENAGWPIYEGNDPHNGFSQIARTLENKDEPNPSNTCNKPFLTFADLLKQAQNEAVGPMSATNPCSAQPMPGLQRRYFHSRPILEWQHGSNVARYPAFDGNNAYPKTIGSGGATVQGQPFGGYCSIAGAWYTGTRFPAEYRDVYFFADYASNWIRVAKFGANGLSEIKPFAPNDFGKGIVDLKYNALDQSLYYININTGEIRRISYGGNRPPVAALSADKLTGTSPLTVTFKGDNSADPDGDPLTYAWDFGDGTTSTAANPTHIFRATGQQGFTVQLTVSDSHGATDRKQVTVSLGNSAPVVKITSPVNNTLYAIDRENQYTLTADVTDDNLTGLTYSWQVSLRHNIHEHREPVLTEARPTVTIAPVGCDGETYYYFIRLTVTDQAGLTATDSVKIYPNCGAGNLAVANLSLTPQSGKAQVSWTNPTLPFDQVMVVVREGSGFNDKPSGNDYRADANFGGAGSVQEGGKVVFKGQGTGVTVTGLTNGKTYFVRVYTMKGASWTGGVEKSVTPQGTALTINANACYKLTGRASGRVLEIDNGSTTDLAPTRLRSYTAKKWQHWKFQATGEGYYQLIAQHSDKALDVMGGSQDDQAAVVQWPATGPNPNQQWKPVSVEDTYYQLVVRHAGKALAVRGESTEEGAALVQLTPTMSQSQQWLIEQVGCETTSTPTPTTPPAVSLRDPENPASTTAGLDYQYYEGYWANLPDFNALTPVKTGTVASPELSVRSRDNSYGLQFKGYVNIPVDGSYTFYTTSDDGSKLFIGSTEVVSNDGQHGDREQSGSIGLKAGKHAVTVMFFQAGGGQTLLVSYAGPGLSKQLIPANGFYRLPTTPTTPTTPTPTTPPTTPVSPDAIYLSDLSWASASNGYGPVEKDKSNGDAAGGDGRSITLNGVSYAKGLGVHANSSISYNLGGKYASFSTDMGLDDEMGNPGCGNVEFVIYLDNVKVYSSGNMNSASATKSVTLEVSGKQTLRLEVSDGGDGISCDHGDWANARLTPASGGSTTPTTPPVANLRDPENPASTTAGLDYQYYEGYWANLPDFNALTPVKTGTVASPELSVRSRDNSYGLQFKGYVNIPVDGSYTFYTTSDDGSKLFIGSTEVVSNDGQHGDREQSGSIGLKAGKHAVTVMFFQAGGGQTLLVSYAGPGLSKQLIPAGGFYRLPTRTTPTTPTTPTPTTPPTTPVSPDAIYLSDLSWTSASNGYGPVEKDKSNGDAAGGDGRSITLNGVSYAKGLGVHANSSISYNLGGKYASFSTDMGLDDEMGNPGCGNVEFVIYLDNVKVYSSGNMNSASATKSVTLEVSGKQTLRLEVSDGGDGISCDHGDWANARLTLVRGGRVATLAETDYDQAEVFPNPARETVLLRYWADKTGTLAMQLLNTLGQPVLVQTQPVAPGENRIGLSVGDLPRGFYVLSLVQDGKRITRKVVLSE